ncbi:MAG: hypothetical protein U0T32_08140 [Chitinophagales bacterium]|jgi:hypothetical protein
MSKKFLIVLGVVVALSAALSSCERHSCPAYSKVENKTAEPRA